MRITPTSLTAKSKAALSDLRNAGSLLLNQSVLLKGVNDSTKQLNELSQRLVAQGVVPYYLHQLDPVAGTTHFGVSDERAMQIVRDLRNSDSGYLVPRLVREIPGEPSKTILF